MVPMECRQVYASMRRTAKAHELEARVAQVKTDLGVSSYHRSGEDPSTMHVRAGPVFLHVR